MGLLVQLAVNVTGVPGATGAEGLAAGEALIVQSGCCANVGPQTTHMTATANVLAIRRSRVPEPITFVSTLDPPFATVAAVILLLGFRRFKRLPVAPVLALQRSTAFHSDLAKV